MRASPLFYLLNIDRTTTILYIKFQINQKLPPLKKGNLCAETGLPLLQTLIPGSSVGIEAAEGGGWDL